MEDPKLAIDTGSFAPQAEDPNDLYSHPYMRIPASDRERVAGQKTDLRKLSAWIRMLRELEEAKKRRGG